jgi:uncharacterized protein
MGAMRAVLRILAKLVEQALVAMVCFYQVAISPILIGNCKYCPSCSDYFIQAVREWGVVRGSWLGFKRLARCTPWGAGGIDPVPRKGSR